MAFEQLGSGFGRDAADYHLAVSKAEAADSIQETLRSLKTLLREGSSASPSEADTRVHFIDPILRALGWTALGEIQREVYVRDTKEFIDYTLSVNGQPRIAVEAKRLSFKLNEAAAGQLIQYCAILGIEWAVLTNGAEWRVYHQFAQVPLAEKLLFRLDLAGWQSEPQYIAIFEQRLGGHSLQRNVEFGNVLIVGAHINESFRCAVDVAIVQVAVPFVG